MKGKKKNMNEKLKSDSPGNNEHNAWADAMANTPEFNAREAQMETQVPVSFNEDGLIYATPEICREDNELLSKECQDNLKIFNKTGILSYDINEQGEFERVIIPRDTEKRIQNLTNLSNSLASIGEDRQNKLADYGVFVRDLYAICDARQSGSDTGAHFSDLFKAVEQHFTDDRPDDYKQNMGNLITKSRRLERSLQDTDDASLGSASNIMDDWYDHFPGYTDDELRCLATAIATESKFDSDKISDEALDWSNEDEHTPYDPIVLHIFNRLNSNGGEEDYKEKVLVIAKELANKQ